MEKVEGYIFSALCSINFLVSCLLFSKVTREQRDPYMDEIFHVPQAQRYCKGKFKEVTVRLWMGPSLCNGLRLEPTAGFLVFDQNDMTACGGFNLNSSHI